MKTKELARGKWFGLFSDIGLNAKQLSGKHTDCPYCGGKDRFRIDVKSDDGNYYCNNCGHGDGFNLYQKITGLSFADACKVIETKCGVMKIKQPLPEKTNEQKLAELKKTWLSANSLNGDDEASKYLAGRGLIIPTALKIHPSLEYFENGKAQNFPAMLAKVTSSDGTSVNIHRTYLHGAQKAPVNAPKKLMQGLGITGGAIRLFEAYDVVGIAEGIETAIASHMIYNIPVWSCISAGGIESFIPPKNIKTVYIFADNDANFVGQSAAFNCARRLIREGYIVHVKIPEQIGDFADKLINY